MPKTKGGRPETYQNPVYPHSFPDPFVLKFRGEYFAYSTDNAADDNVFTILRSRDLVNWSKAGRAMKPLEPSPPYYWAPEVTYDNGKFYLYYSTGNETLMELRVAVSDRPDGGFVDSGRRLTNEEFAIDAHVFIDDDDMRYMFYATDFLEHTHIGTGTVVDRMVDWFTLEGRPRPVTRARYDWQVYDPARKEKGGVRWHTVEGPTVMKRKGIYFEMFSGGNWQNMTYGVSFAIASDINSQDEWTQFSDGEKILPILLTIPGKVVGPGHNSVVRGPNNRELYCVYHRWTDAGRVLAIDRMDFAGNRIFVAGPTMTPQPAPFPHADRSSQKIPTGWTLVGDEFVSKSGQRRELPISPPGGSFLCESTFRFLKRNGPSRAGFILETTGSKYKFTILPDKAHAILEGEDEKHCEIEFPPDFDPSAYHLLRIEVSAGRCAVMVDTRARVASVEIEGPAVEIIFFSEGAGFGLSSLEMTGGFEANFDASDEIPPELSVEAGTARISEKCLLLTAAVATPAIAVFRLPYHEFELAANLAVSDISKTAEYGLLLFGSERKPLGRLSASPGKHVVVFELEDRSARIDLPEAFQGNEVRQFHIISKGGKTTAYLDGITVAELAVDIEITDAGVFTDSKAIVDMLRVTHI